MSKLFDFVSQFYQDYPSFKLSHELSIIMQICEAKALTEKEEEKALQAFQEIEDGLHDGTIKSKEVKALVEEIRENLLAKSLKAKVVYTLMQLGVENKETIDQIMGTISSVPKINAMAISREIAGLRPSKNLLNDLQNICASCMKF